MTRRAIADPLSDLDRAWSDPDDEPPRSRASRSPAPAEGTHVGPPPVERLAEGTIDEALELDPEPPPAAPRSIFGLRLSPAVTPPAARQSSGSPVGARGPRRDVPAGSGLGRVPPPTPAMRPALPPMAPRGWTAPPTPPVPRRVQPHPVPRAIPRASSNHLAQAAPPGTSGAEPRARPPTWDEIEPDLIEELPDRGTDASAADATGRYVAATTGRRDHDATSIVRPLTTRTRRRRWIAGTVGAASGFAIVGLILVLAAPRGARVAPAPMPQPALAAPVHAAAPLPAHRGPATPARPALRPTISTAQPARRPAPVREAPHAPQQPVHRAAIASAPARPGAATAPTSRPRSSAFAQPNDTATTQRAPGRPAAPVPGHVTGKRPSPAVHKAAAPAPRSPRKQPAAKKPPAAPVYRTEQTTSAVKR